ncbi:MAG: hypothetical protein M3418_02150 [Gemmatimonadota bacterium]|nr:hypothetical protein [Gemmatimonadota bacterium]
MPSKKQGAFVGRVESALSPARLERFRLSASEPKWEALARYAWNVSICEAFYPLLHHLEVVLRNSANRLGAASYPYRRTSHIDSWLDADPSPLHPKYGVKDVEKAKVKLFGRERTTGALIPPSRRFAEGDLVAALDFEFWTGLFNTYYRGRNQRNRGLWPHGLATVFPYAPTPPTLSQASSMLNDVRHLRNRIFHHEPIWRRRLADDQTTILTLIGWIAPEVDRTLRSVERVSEVLSEVYRRNLRVRVYWETRR